VTNLVGDDELLLRRVTMPAGKSGHWRYQGGRFVVPGKAWEDLHDEPSVYCKSIVDVDRFMSNCGLSPAPQDNGCFGIHAKAVRTITTIMQRDGKGQPIPDRPFTVEVVPSPSDCEAHAHAVIKTVQPVHAGKREIRQSMQTNLAMIAEAYINGEQAGGGWERMPPGLQELQAKG